MKKNNLILWAVFVVAGLLQNSAYAMYDGKKIPSNYAIKCAAKTFNTSARRSKIFAAYFFRKFFNDPQTRNLGLKWIKNNKFVDRISNGDKFSAETKKRTQKIILDGTIKTLKDAILSGNVEYVMAINSLFKKTLPNQSLKFLQPLITYVDKCTNHNPLEWACESGNQEMVKYVKKFSSKCNMQNLQIRHLDKIRRVKRAKLKRNLDINVNPVTRNLFGI